MHIKQKWHLFMLLILIVLISSCSIKPKLYYFKCSEQTPQIVCAYFPEALNSLDYTIAKIDSAKHSLEYIIFEASKPIKMTNTKKGVEHESIRIKIRFNFDTTNSEMAQYLVKELNGKEHLYTLDKEYSAKYEDDMIKLQEKTLFYCNPKFRGR